MAACQGHANQAGWTVQEAEEALNRSRRGSAQRLPHAISDTNLPSELSNANGTRRISSYSSASGPASPSPAGRSVSYLDKLESLASSAVRAAEKVGAKLIIVFTRSGS